MQIVNGYVCNNCTDVEHAKKGVDPAHPKEPPPEVKRAREAERDGPQFGPAVLFGGAVTAANRPSEPGAVRSPTPDVGGHLSIRV